MFEKFLAAIAALTEALIANTAAHGGKAPAASKEKEDDEDAPKQTAAQKKAAAAKAAAKEKEGDDDKPARSKKVTREDLTALMNTVKEDLGAPVAKKLIKDIGGVERLAEVDDDDIKELFDAATKKLGAAAEKGGEDDNL